MRFHVRHETTYRYVTPAARAVEILRLTPRGHDGQSVLRWRVEVDRDCRLLQSSDAFGNAIHTFTVEGPFQQLAIAAEGDVETEDAGGIVRGQVERFPPVLFLRETALTAASSPIRALGDDAGSATGGQIAILHRLMQLIRDQMRFDVEPTDASTTAAEAFAFGRGVCQDFAHIFIAAARHLGTPARYVGGYLFRPGKTTEEAGHGWAEAHVEGVGWIGFDPANGVSPTDRYVRVAVGLDYLGSAPVRGTRLGGTGETMEVTIEVRADEATRAAVGNSHTQSQGQ